MKELTAGAEHARMQPLDATGYEMTGNSRHPARRLFQSIASGRQHRPSVVNGTVLFKAHEHSKTPCSVIKLSK